MPGTVVLSCGRDFQGTQGIESFARAYGLSSQPPTYVAVALREEYHEQYFVYSVPEDRQPGRLQFPLGRSALSIWTSQSPSIPAALSSPQMTAYAPEKLTGSPISEATIPEMPRPRTLPELPPDWLQALTGEALRAENDLAAPHPVQRAFAQASASRPDGFDRATGAPGGIRVVTRWGLRRGQCARSGSGHRTVDVDDKIGRC